MKAEIVIGGIGAVCAILAILLGIYFGSPWPEIGALVAASVGITSIILVVEKDVKKRRESINLKITGLTLTPYFYDEIKGCEKIKGYTGYFEVTNKGKKIAYNLTAEIGVCRSMGYYVEILEPTLMKYVTEKLHAKKVDIEDIHKDHADRIAYEWFDEEKHSYGRVLPKIRKEDRVFVAFPQGMGSFVDWENKFPRSLLLVSGRKHEVEVVIKAEDSEKNSVIKKRIFEVIGPSEDEAFTIFIV